MSQQVSEQKAADEAGQATGLRVLVVEDEALIRLDLTEMLTEEGYVIAGEAGDGEQAVELATRRGAGFRDVADIALDVTDRPPADVVDAVLAGLPGGLGPPSRPCASANMDPVSELPPPPGFYRASDGQDYAIPFASIHSAKLLLTDKLINATAPLSTEGADTIQTVED